MFLIWSGNQLQEYADSLERRLANAEVEEETTKHELSELKIQNIVVEEKQKENTNEITKQNKINNNKIIEYEFIIKDMNNIIMQLKNDQKVNYIDNKKDNHFNEENEKTIEEKSFQFLDSIIEVNSFIFYKNSLIILIIIFVNIIIIVIIIIIIIIIILTIFNTVIITYINIIIIIIIIILTIFNTVIITYINIIIIVIIIIIIVDFSVKIFHDQYLFYVIFFIIFCVLSRFAVLQLRIQTDSMLFYRLIHLIRCFSFFTSSDHYFLIIFVLIQSFICLFVILIVNIFFIDLFTYLLDYLFI